MRSLGALTAFLLIVSSGALAARAPGTPYIDYSPPPDWDFTSPADCEKYFHAICANRRLGPWLPVLMDIFDWLRLGTSQPVGFGEGFAYEGSAGKVDSWGSTIGFPADGTGFVYGQAGPPRGAAVYDYVHHIAYYSQGCCDWNSTVLAANAGPPPVHVVARDLHALRTLHGVFLGETARQVEAVYGRAPLRAVPGHPHIEMLSYKHPFNRDCAQWQDFGFLRDRLIFIDLTSAC